MTDHAPASDAELDAEAEDIFYEALQIPDAAGREEYLSRMCSGKSSLRLAVDAMLSSHARADGFFRAGSAALKPPTEFAAASSAHDAERGTEGIGFQLGSYKLVQCLGEGGSGVVYLAQQETPVSRSVAVKILKPGMDTRQVIARFETERQTLAMMEHPHIAHVLDAGMTGTGRPYFVMELVRGESITDYCLRIGAPLIERLQLFQQVCQAVQHAHQKGVIHRDLKPSNILVALHDTVPVLKVIDFGIAKAIGAASSDAHITQRDQVIGTPAYMSPEQAEGGCVDVDTRSDIYSLGVVLYELLAGRPPFQNEELLKGGVDEMRRKLRSEEPLRPSAVVVIANTRNRIHDASRRAQVLRGDLDWIVMKALEKDRDRRYETVRGLWLDIERYLTNDPVEARPPSRVYRLQKLIRRNKVLFAAIGSTTLALIAGLAVSTWLYLRAAAAERQQMNLRAVAEHALRQEAILRQKAEDRERIANAAILLVERKFEEADGMVERMEGQFTQPSVEAANVLRSLAEWHILRGDTRSAAKRSLALLDASRFEGNDKPDMVTRDMVVAAPILVEAGDLVRYEELRVVAVDRFAGTLSPIAAEQVMKTCLLLPPGNEMLGTMNPLAVVEENCVKSRVGSVIDKAWGSAALGLLEYRRGAWQKAADWSARARGFGSYRNRALDALCLAVEAMARGQLGEKAEAQNQLKEARKAVDGWFERPARNSESGAWNDWLIARILMREAERVVE